MITREREDHLLASFTHTTSRVCQLAGCYMACPTKGRADETVAHGKDNGVGLSYGYHNQRDSGRRALSERCERCGPCRIVRRFENTSASVATGRGYSTIVSGCDE